MGGYHKPELVVGVEAITPGYAEQIPDGPLTQFFCQLAKQYGIYLIPGSIGEKSDDKIFNTATFINPHGKVVGKYRKATPWHPAESHASPGGVDGNMPVFDIPEKNTKVGIQICYDINFPEISRNQALLGAEVLIKLTMDPEELRITNNLFHEVRAIENQAYMVCTNGVGQFLENSLYGHSMVVSPEGRRIWEAENAPTISCITLDLDQVSRASEYGTLFRDHYLKHVKEFNINRMFNDDIASAPVYKTLSEVPKNSAEYQERFNANFGLIGYGKGKEYPFSPGDNGLQEYLSTKQDLGRGI